jgi:hypothetical protein
MLSTVKIVLILTLLSTGKATNYSFVAYKDCLRAEKIVERLDKWNEYKHRCVMTVTDPEGGASE